MEYSADGMYPAFPEDSSYLFNGWSSLAAIVHLDRVNTSNVKDMSFMFAGCTSLASLDLWNFNTVKVTNLSNMFDGCKSLTSLNLSSFNTSKVTDMEFMFRGCELLMSLNLQNFNTFSVENMSYMFAGCKQLSSLGLLRFNTSSVADMSEMFSDCRSLTSLNLSSFDTSLVEKMDGMFRGCHSLVSLNLSNFSTPNVTDISQMFFECKQLSSLNLASFNTARMTDFENALAGLSKLERLTLGAGFKLPLGGLGLGKPHSPHKPGHQATHRWRDESTGKEYDPFGIPTSYAATYVAGYDATTYSYRVKFDRNDGTGVTTEQLFTSGSTQALRTNNFTRTDYKFTGWNTQSDGRGKSYSDGQDVKDLGKNDGAVVTLYAQWQPIPKKPATKYTVQFDTHGGSTVPSQQVTSGTKASRPSDPRRTGYTFVGWTADAAGRQRYNFDSLVHRPITLHAQWKPIPQLKRLGGPGRYDTMSRIVRESHPQTVSTVIVASGENYPDALAASGLAGALNASIVLTTPSSLSPQAAAELGRLKPKRIIIAGGPQAVSKHVQWQLSKYARAVERHGGADRYETAYMLYQRGRGLWKATAIMATGEDYADALSVSSYAYKCKAPVFLSNPHSGLRHHHRAALTKFRKVAVVGGHTAVPPKHTNGLPGCIRLGGPDRYQTSVIFAQWALRNGLGANGAVFAKGSDFPDALVAGPLAGRNGAPILLVESRYSASVHFARYQFGGKVSTAYVVGGTQAVSLDTASAIAAALRVRQL
ncbi:cell wall-binding repeat-containing protein [Bifidobacterium panos]|uniref:cell wall-binding repeat-containing protein n=1 Tax=Bifidobacterium panos TaxID=2675321 RepID=UPI00155492C9